MAEILKITSPNTVKSNVQNLNRQIAPDALFDLLNPLAPVKPQTQVAPDQKGMARQGLLQDLNRTILEPLMTPTGAQSGKLRELLLLGQLFEISWGKLSGNIVDRLFVSPEDLLGELMKQDKGATLFRGEIFDSLRMLSTVKGQPQLTEAIANILKFFDCFVSQDSSLKTIASQAESLVTQISKKMSTNSSELADLTRQLSSLIEAAQSETPQKIGQSTQNGKATIFPWQTLPLDETELPEGAKPALSPAEEKAAQVVAAEEGNLDPKTKKTAAESLDLAMSAMPEEETEAAPTKEAKIVGLPNKETEQAQKELQRFLKDDYLPALSKLIKEYPGNERIRNSVMDLIHHVVRYDKADITNLEDAAFRLGEILKPLTSINEQGIKELKTLLIQTAVETQNRDAASSDLADLLETALEKGSPEKITRVAQTLLSYMVQNESPILPFVYFMIPIKFMDENIYAEFLIDRECKKKRGDAKEAMNVFFTIQSDEFGSFEVELLAKDLYVDLDIKCPAGLLDAMKENRPGLRSIIEEQGYRLSNYNVAVCKEAKSILERFPELGERKVGIDVKI